VQQEGTQVGLRLLDGPAQRRLGHVQARRSPPEVTIIGDGDGDEVPQRPWVHHQ
jgi:hypothetical protein